MSNIVIRAIFASGDFAIVNKRCILLHKLYKRCRSKYDSKQCVCEPELLGPAVTIRPLPTSKMAVRLFCTGKILLLGGKSVKEIDDAYNSIMDTLYK
jgi:TATA-box binding protein (TBP) (component of TFIID and TFIIIB)